MAIYLTDDACCSVIEMLHIPLSDWSKAGKLRFVNDGGELSDQGLL